MMVLAICQAEFEALELVCKLSIQKLFLLVLFARVEQVHCSSVFDSLCKEYDEHR